MRVFLGLSEIAGYYANLRQGLTELGVESFYIDLSRHPFHYQGSDHSHPLVRIVHTGAQCRASGGLRQKLLWKLIEVLARAGLLIEALRTCDVFIFGFLTSFLWFADLPLLKLMGKRVIFVFHGSDARPPYLDGSLMAHDRGLTIAQCVLFTWRKWLTLRVIERFADAIISQPPIAQLQRRPFVSFLRVGLPYRSTVSDLPRPTTTSDVIRILHSPSHPEAKGTPQIREMIRRLQAKGHRVELEELTGVPNAVVLAELAACDFVIDQIYSDTPMAGFATEAALFGKPAVVGGYAQEAALIGLPDELVPPSVYRLPDEIEAAVEHLITNPEAREALGRAAQAFVTHAWTPRAVAERFLRIIQDDLPDDWLVDPREICYLHGFGLSDARARALVRATIAKGGTISLRLGHRPDLKQRLVEFAGEGA